MLAQMKADLPEPYGLEVMPILTISHKTLSRVITIIQATEHILPM